tara:strand:+ start:41 stop:367 length:327 start_codon:yes stop_codon:yes gene_type:complete
MAKPGLYANIHAKRERIKAGSGEKMRRKGAKGAPTEENFKEAAKTAKKMHGGVAHKMTHGGEGKLHGGQKKLDKNNDGKISGTDFKMMKHGGEVLAGNANRRRHQQGG